MTKKSVNSTEAASMSPMRKNAKERLAEVAEELFYRKGIRAVGVDEIVNVTGVTKPTLYRSFESKDALVVACLAKSYADVGAALDSIAERYRDDPLEHLRAIIRFHADRMTMPDYRGCPSTNAAVEFPELGHPARAIAEQSKANMRGRLKVVARQTGTSEPDALADGLMLLLEGACTSRHTSGSQGPSTALISASEALLKASSG
jgi:AcrR family transcriptional regulator